MLVDVLRGPRGVLAASQRKGLLFIALERLLVDSSLLAGSSSTSNPQSSAEEVLGNSTTPPPHLSSLFVC